MTPRVTKPRSTVGGGKASSAYLIDHLVVVGLGASARDARVHPDHVEAWVALEHALYLVLVRPSPIKIADAVRIVMDEDRQAGLDAELVDGIERRVVDARDLAREKHIGEVIMTAHHLHTTTHHPPHTTHVHAVPHAE